MSQIIDHILSSVCLDERVTDGIFRLGEESHMNALRDHLVKRGLALEDAISVTNRMLEGKYPERQAWRKEDGILVTWPSIKHKQKAMSENPGKYVEENPIPKKEPSPEPEPKQDLVPLSPSPPREPEPKGVEQDGKFMAIEPPRGPEPPSPPPFPPEPPVIPPKTPEEISAQKAVVQQMIKTDDTAITQLHPPPIPESCIKQLRVLQEYALCKGLNEARIFLSKYVV